MTLEALIAEARALGLQFNNLIELQDGIWRCNLRHRGTDVCHAWARGKTAADAVDRALRYHRAQNPKAAVEVVAAAEAAGGRAVRLMATTTLNQPARNAFYPEGRGKLDTVPTPSPATCNSSRYATGRFALGRAYARSLLRESLRTPGTPRARQGSTDGIVADWNREAASPSYVGGRARSGSDRAGSTFSSPRRRALCDKRPSTFSSGLGLAAARSADHTRRSNAQRRSSLVSSRYDTPRRIFESKTYAWRAAGLVPVRNVHSSSSLHSVHFIAAKT